MRRFVLAVMVVFGIVSMANAAEVKNTSGIGDSKIDACAQAKHNAEKEAKESGMKVVAFGECACEQRMFSKIGCTVDYRVVPNR